MEGWVGLRRVEVLRTLHDTSQSYGMPLAIWDQTVLPATQHKWTHPALTPARGLYSIYLPRMDGRLSWPSWLHRRFSRTGTVTHPSTYWPSSRVELATCWSQVRRPNHYTTTPLNRVIHCRPVAKGRGHGDDNGDMSPSAISMLKFYLGIFG